MNINNIIIFILAFITGVSLSLFFSIWEANTELSTKIYNLNETIEGYKTTQGFTNESLRVCKGESQMYKFNLEICEAQDYNYEYYYK